MALVSAKGLTLSYDGTRVLDGVSFEVEEGEILALLGPSGCGKTSILRVLAGLVRAEAGTVSFDGEVIDGVPSHRRGFGMMFQEFALFPHLNVAANLEFGLRMQSLGRAERQSRVGELLELVGLSGYEERSVHQLSGGERQRVALARSLGPRPRLLMLDEPMGSLDRGLRDALLLELRGILTQLGQTSIYVTHDQDEAFSLADRILIMDRGTIRQEGRPETIFAQPADAFVARFIGLGNLIAAEAGSGNMARTAIGDFELPPTVVGLRPHDQITLLLGDEQASIARVNPGDVIRRAEGTTPNSFLGRVQQRSFGGRSLTFRIEAEGRIEAEIRIENGGQIDTEEYSFLFAVDTRREHRGLAEGDWVRVTLEPGSIRVLR
ncbi:MAG: ABC transporter ATP-binding protein [Chloroflexi bacterium]|nr:ABC transporter ATP-binding protein [Chloroflexota bacterium]